MSISTLFNSSSSVFLPHLWFRMSAAEFSSVSASSLWISTCVWFWLCSHVEGEPIIAAPGDDVILPCRLDSQEDLQDQAVEWIKVDMKHFVYLYWSRTIITEHMNESLIPRVSLDQDGLKRGDVTLKIRNVSLQDEGKYSCFIPGKNFRETVQLVVEPNGVRAPTMETSQVDIISTPDPGGDRIWISRSRPALWILLGLFTLVILSAVCVCVCQRKQPEGQELMETFNRP